MRILRSVNNTGTQFRECGILFDCKENRVQLQGVYFQSMNSGFSINSPIRSCSEFHRSIMVSYLFSSQKICQRVFLSCRERENLSLIHIYLRCSRNVSSEAAFLSFQTLFCCRNRSSVLQNHRLDKKRQHLSIPIGGTVSDRPVIRCLSLIHILL